MEDDRFVLDEESILTTPEMARLDVPGAAPKDAEKPSDS
jgi:hypothetical protein